MAKEINLTSQKWNDIVFEGKNKDYGAYEMRQSSSKRHIMALIAIIALTVLVSFLPLIIKTIVPNRKAENLSESTVLADLQKQLEEEIKEKDMLRDETPPPPELKSTIQFTAPEIVPAEDIKDNELKSMEDLSQSTAQVSIADVQGVDKGGVDIADLQVHKVVAEVKAEEILTFVEQMPSFPGGESALLKYLRSKINYPKIAAENGVQGRVMIQFVVGTDGSISDVSVLQSIDRSLDAEAVRVVNAMPKWIAGKQNGQAVKVRYTLPVNFKLE